MAAVRGSGRGGGGAGGGGGGGGGSVGDSLRPASRIRIYTWETCTAKTGEVGAVSCRAANVS